MSVDETILLKQILDELKVQSQYLFDMRKRLEELEKAVGRITDATKVNK
ncbi:MAG: hypothetical protein NT131_03720 [Methanomassiliicoccales archaeon]|nr:hypothetical protein [Methanomassiliicoccales archaeon]